MKYFMRLWTLASIGCLVGCLDTVPGSPEDDPDSKPKTETAEDAGVEVSEQTDSGQTSPPENPMDAGFSWQDDAGFAWQDDAGWQTEEFDAGQVPQEVDCAHSTQCISNDDCCTPGCTNDEDNDCDNSTVISIQPYLQSPTPTSVWILWETQDHDESLVDWGLTDDLVNTTTGTSFSPFLSGTIIHEVHLENLEPDTLYFYQVQTQGTQSTIYHFVTTTTGGSEASTRLVAMSDMQKDSANPDKFREIVEEGVLAYVANQWPEADLTDLLDLVLVPGDLVDSGLFISQFRNDFFAPSQKLLSYVPVFPVLGNHEINHYHYFDLFHLPEQASGSDKEHWWYSDHSNLRVIGLDSNWPYTTDTQLEWLESTLDNACNNLSIDFVFAELHHPAKSEAWPVGESDFTSDVVERMESFTATCDKPSIHFFGHTHGYSRGQSRDHRHLWVNVASAGGNLDYWDEYSQTDYDEFNISLDEYGFVLVDVEAGSDPSFYLRRISRGDQYTTLENEIKDEILVRRYNQSPEKPTGLSPATDDLCIFDLVLSATAFTDPDTDSEHGASHWQISTDCDDFASPAWESWEQHENWYRDEDLQAGNDLTDESVTTLTTNGSYCWHVRYRDKGLTWSEWSDAVAFSTAASATCTE